MKPKAFEKFVLSGVLSILDSVNIGKLSAECGMCQWGNHVGESYNDTFRYNVWTKFMFCNSTDIYCKKEKRKKSLRSANCPTNIEKFLQD